jgi:UDP-glucose 4-epimerase
MTVLVTGIAGYIGSHTAIELLEAGHTVVGIDNLMNSDKTTIDAIVEAGGYGFDFYEADCCNVEQMDAIFDEHRIECIMHFAGHKSVPESVAHPLPYYGNNLSATLNMCLMMERFRVEKMVFSSSATVYHPENKMPLTEAESGIWASSPYGWTKMMIEQILRDLARANPNLSIAILRYFNPVGAHESGLIGDNPKGIPNNLVPFISRVAKGIYPKLALNGNDYDTPDGTCIRDYIHITDLAKGHVAALEWCNNYKGADSFNLGTGKGYSVLEIIKTFEKTNSIMIPYEIAPRRPGDMPISYSDPSKAHKMLNWKAEKTLEDMMRDTWNFQKNQKQ